MINSLSKIQLEDAVISFAKDIVVKMENLMNNSRRIKKLANKLYFSW